MAGKDELVEILRARNLPALRAALKKNPEAARAKKPIGEAGRMGWLEAIQVLVAHGADLNSSGRGYRPLHSLIQEEPHNHHEATDSRVACLHWMLEHGADPELLGAWPPARALLVAAFVGERRYVDALIAGGAVVNGFVAAALGDTVRVRKILKSEPEFAKDRDAGGLTALQCCCASRMGREDAKVSRSLLEIATLLLDHGADVNARTRSWSNEVDVAYFACSSNQKQILELLLDRGADVNQALPSAVWRKETDLAEIVLRYGAKPDLAVADGRALLNELVRWGQIEPALWLLAHGASPDVPDERGWTAVHQAASRGNERMLKALLDAEGDRSRKDKSGYTPLDIARSVRKPKIMKLLSPGL